jgi:glycosyltransferase involved in cell wall biosynthesis
MIESVNPTKQYKLIVVMPAFNESEGIAEFVRELDVNLAKYLTSFIVIDDCSTDRTSEELLALKETELERLSVHRNSDNQGHGWSTLLGLSLALQECPDLVLACDGDGQISGPDARNLVDELVWGNVMVVEGSRVGGHNSFYRRAVSYVTRVLVFLRCGIMPRDANTPFRAYRLPALRSVLSQREIGGLVPNLRISAYVRKAGLEFLEVPVISRSRRGSVATGSTWIKSTSILPSRRFVAFCAKALLDWTRRTS